MFAGLPGFGVGTLFYVVLAIWMPIRELGHLARGASSWARWRLIGQQLYHAGGIIVSVMLAERLLLWALGHGGPRAVSPALVLTGAMNERAAGSLLAAPITISLLMLAAVLVAVELARWVLTWHTRGMANPPSMRLLDEQADSTAN